MCFIQCCQNDCSNVWDIVFLLLTVQVSWVRHRDIHLLTVGRYTYTSDQRFEALHSPHTEEWTLRIRYAQRKDSGVYEVSDKNEINLQRTIECTLLITG